MKLFLAALSLALSIFSCGAKKSDEATDTTTTYATVSGIIAESCMGAACHTNGANTTTCGDFTSSETKYKAAQACKTTANTPAARLQLASSNSLFMPQSPGKISDANKTKLVDFK